MSLPLKRLPTEDEMNIIIEYVSLLSIYITDDHNFEFETDNPSQVKAYDDLMAKLY